MYWNYTRLTCWQCTRTVCTYVQHDNTHTHVLKLHQTDMLTVYMCLQGDNITRAVFTQSIDVLYRGFLWSTNPCPSYATMLSAGTWQEFLPLLTDKHNGHYITCRCQWADVVQSITGLSFNTMPFVCCVPEHALPCQWTGTIGIHHLVHTIVSQPKHLLCCRQEHYRSLQDVYISHSLVPRLPRSEMQTLKLCRWGEPGIYTTAFRVYTCIKTYNLYSSDIHVHVHTHG